MNSLQRSDNATRRKRGKMLPTLGLWGFIAILVFNGTFFRVRPMGEIPEMDWLVLSRLITSAFGLVVGVILILKSHARFGSGSIILSLFLLATGISSINSPYPTIVAGYFIVLLGAGVLTIGLVYNAQNLADLERIERVWLITVIICILKDATISILFPDVDAEGGIIRLGMGITHANQISLLGGLAFWLSFKQTGTKKFLWFIRIALLFIIIGAISRVSILVFLVGGFFYIFLRAGDYIKKWIFVFVCLSGIVLFFLTLSLSQRWASDIVLYAKRGQSQSELVAVTGRTYIWDQVMRQIPESPLIGHGYGITRFTLKPPWEDFKVAHCHNEFLEALFTTGILGFIPLVLMYFYNLKWIKSFSSLKRTFSSDLALHAVIVVAMLVLSTMFEARISAKLFPFQPLFFYYLLILDREKQFAFMRTEN